MKAVSLRTVALALVATIALSGLVLVGGTLWLSQRIATTQDEWRAYRDANSPRAIALIDIGKHLGFGGTIHHLKNYILRGLPVDADRMEIEIGGVRAALARYRSASPEANEVMALDAIENTVFRLEQSLATAQSMRAQGDSPEIINDVATFDSQPTLDALATLDSMVAARRQSRTSKTTKLEMLYELRRAIGFGGMIHFFKDLVLRRDPGLADNVRNAIAAARRDIGDYRSDGISPEEQAALREIEQVIDRYVVNLDFAVAMAAGNLEPIDIDRRVRVNDEPALKALAQLELAIAATAGDRSRQIDRTLSVVTELSRAMVVMAVMIGLLICGFVAWALIHAVQEPLTRIATSMVRVARGEAVEAVAASSNITEVAELGHALQVFQGHAQELALHVQSLQQFQQMSTDPDLDFAGRVKRILRLGLDHFGMSLGTASRTGGGEYVVEHSVATDEEPPRVPGTHIELETTYCWHTLKANHAVAYHDVPQSPLAGELCHRTFNRNAYIGAPILVDGRIYGTINFSSHKPRARPFTIGDRAFIELIARWLGMERERELNLQQLAAAKTDAEDAARAKAEFLANMSHEIRTPMNAVIGLSGLALKTELSDRARDYLEKINRSSMMLLRIINDILDFSKIEAGQLTIEATAFDLDDVLQDVATLVGDLQDQKPVEIVFSTDPEIPRTLLGDPLRIGQVLLNLVSNALKFTEEGEIVVRIVAGERRGDRQVLEVSVADTGIGMTGEQLTRLFSAFAQADGSTTRRFGGTGLGLAICKQLVELMGGEIHAESTYGQGSTFTFTVEVGDQGEGRRRELPKQIDPNKVRILVVEDNAIARAVLHDTLRGLRFTDVEVAPDGSMAISRFDEALARGEPYDVVILDWRMPGMDGIATARQLKALTTAERRTGIVMMTAHARADIVEQAAEVGVARVMFKPLNVSMLVDGIADALDLGTGARAVTADGQPAAEAGRSGLIGKRVLVAEDNEINQQIAREILEDAGMAVDVVDTGAAALNWLRGADTLPDVVLMDLQMPELDGYEATRWLRADERFADLPIIAMTAHVTADERRRCLDAGMVDHVGKPVEVRQLLDTLERWLGRAPGDAGPGTGDTRRQDASASDQGEPASEVVLDIEGTRARLGLPEQAMKRAVDRFAAEYRDAPQKLMELVDDESWKEAERYAHTMVGLSATIGAVQLAERSRELERGLNAGPSSGIGSPDLKAFDQAHAAVFAELDRIDRRDPPMPSQTASAAPDGSRLVALVKEMDAGLATNRISVRRRFDSLREACGDIGVEELERLSANLASLDFIEARRALRALAEAHRIPLDQSDV